MRKKKQDTPAPPAGANRGSFLIYQSGDGRIKLDVRLENESLWLTQPLMAELFQTTQQNISQHILNIYEEGELSLEATHKKFLSVRQEGSRQVQRELDYYNLDMIISAGYRIKSLIATRFRIWATQRLREYIVKGFTMDDERLKQAGGGGYFEELLARIRDIRSSEKIFWRKVLDIYATSIDYNPCLELSREFFKVIQNKMHWAAHGQTAAEVIYGRADASKPNMGMTNWVGPTISKSETEIAKNYLTEDELNLLNRIVTMYLEFAEIQALNRTPMTMQDWIKKLDGFLKLSGRELLTHAGKITHDAALQKAHQEYEEFHQNHLKQPTRAEIDFIQGESELKQIEAKLRSKENGDESRVLPTPTGIESGYLRIRRVAQQYPTKKPGRPPYRIVLEESVMRNDGSSFTDREVHRWLRQQDVSNPKGEWFACPVNKVKAAIIAVRSGQLNEENRTLNFIMRPEQAETVEKTAAYFKRAHREDHDKTPHFLWNAKMRFGKTFAAYQLAKKMGWRKVLVMTFKPAVQHAWESDLKQHVDFRGWQFISPGGLTYEEADKSKPFVCFGSFQDYLGRNRSTGGIKTKNEWVHTGAKTPKSCSRRKTGRKENLAKGKA
jgi:hypothetical protein